MMRKLLAVVTFMVLASTVWVVSPRDLEGQNPVTVRAQVHAIGVDSVVNGSLITYFTLGANSVAERVHIALRQQVEVASMHGVPEFGIGVAVLDSADWESISPYPYGFPHFVGPPGSIVFTPSWRTQPENADTLLSGRADELAAVGHEVGHLLTSPWHRKSSETVCRHRNSLLSTSATALVGYTRFLCGMANSLQTTSSRCF